MMSKPADTDAYIASFPADLQAMLQLLRKTIKTAVPDAAEIISYGMPGYKQNGMVAWFACHTNHVGLYMRPAAKEAFIKELEPFKGSKSSVHFQLNKPMPLDLIGKIVKHQAAQNMEKQALKKKNVNAKNK